MRLWYITLILLYFHRESKPHKNLLPILYIKHVRSNETLLSITNKNIKPIIGYIRTRYLGPNEWPGHFVSFSSCFTTTCSPLYMLSRAWLWFFSVFSVKFMKLKRYVSWVTGEWGIWFCHQKPKSFLSRIFSKNSIGKLHRT